jgi:hypothetical protein
MLSWMHWFNRPKKISAAFTTLKIITFLKFAQLLIFRGKRFPERAENIAKLEELVCRAAPRSLVVKTIASQRQERNLCISTVK